MTGELEDELVRVVVTLEELQQRYLSLLEAAGEEEEQEDGDPAAALEDYERLCGRLEDWVEQAGRGAGARLLAHRATTRCLHTSHASLLCPALVTLASLAAGLQPDQLTQAGPAFRRLAIQLADKV